MKNSDMHKEMLIQVALGLGQDLLNEIVFVGGCTTALLVTDDFTREQVRHTDDVDLIAHLDGYASYIKLISKLKSREFKERLDNDAPVCAMWLGDLRVDIVPDDETILGFSNRWYKDAVKTADDYQLTDNIKIRLIKPVHFVATKLDAYLGRGNGDPMASHDIEDILNLFDGSPELLSELALAPVELRFFIAEQITSLLNNHNFEYAVQSCAMGDSSREHLIFDKLEASCQLGNSQVSN
jgi:predicted nucleotidyltransferase